MLKLNVILIFTLLQCSFAFINVYPKLKQIINLKGDAGQPLFLTPLIEAGKIKEAQNASQVHFKGFENVESYSGYITVNETYNSNMFFWFFRSLNANNSIQKEPVLIWLQGGPGATSLFGLFNEIGPFIITADQKVQMRKWSWIQNHHVLFIDNPVGTGYSFTENNAGYATNQEDVGNNLYNLLLQFFKLFPDLQEHPFYVTGESYAGKYVPAIAYTIHKNNQNAKQIINLKGIAIGNGLSDPYNQNNYGDYLYQLGLIDSHARDLFVKWESLVRNLIKREKWTDAFNCFDNLLNGDKTNGSSLFANVTGYKTYFNYLHAKGSAAEDYFGKFIQSPEVRKAIHVGNKTFHTEASIVEEYLTEDVMKSVAPWISELLSHYRVLIYNGQLDIIVAYPLTENYLKNLQFAASDVYKTAPRKIWYVNDEIAGYYKEAGNLVEVLVRNAGHMVPMDQPEWAFNLITTFTSK